MEASDRINSGRGAVGVGYLATGPTKSVTSPFIFQ
jgi:hypothetical protein